MGHPHSYRLKHMFKSCISKPHHIHYNLPLTCSNCVGSKSHKFPFSSSSSFYDNLFHLVHSDVWCPSPIFSRMKIITLCYLLIMYIDIHQCFLFEINLKFRLLLWILLSMCIHNFIKLQKNYFYSREEYKKTNLVEFLKNKEIISTHLLSYSKTIE